MGQDCRLLKAEPARYKTATNASACLGPPFITVPLRSGSLFWPDDIQYTTVPAEAIIGHRQVTAAYLAQLARAHGGRLATFDQGLAKVHADIAELVPG